MPNAVKRGRSESAASLGDSAPRLCALGATRIPAGSSAALHGATRKLRGSSKGLEELRVGMCELGACTRWGGTQHLGAALQPGGRSRGQKAPVPPGSPCRTGLTREGGAGRGEGSWARRALG